MEIGDFIEIDVLDKCPFCESIDSFTHDEPYFVENNLIWCEAVCRKCGGAWTENYAPFGYSVVTLPRSK